MLDGKVPVTVAVSDNMAAIPDLIRPWVGGSFHVMGTEGFVAPTPAKTFGASTARC